jgi:cytochrome c oxidase cbb3-type subunit II
MNRQDTRKPSSEHSSGHGRFSAFVHGLDRSAIVTVIGIILLFSGAVVTTLLAPRYIDPTWTSPSSPYQMQMYEVSDPNVYISSASSGSATLEFVYHLKDNASLLAFQESNAVRIVAPPHLEKFVTKLDDKILKLTAHLMLLRKPQSSPAFDAAAAAEKLREESLKKSAQKHPKRLFEILELYEPGGQEAFAVAPTDQVVENWVDEHFEILSSKLESSAADTPSYQAHHHANTGVIYIPNPREYRMGSYLFNDQTIWQYDPAGSPVKSLEELKTHPLGFHSRAELIAEGEHLYAIEGCWYCHTDQTRTLVQDVVLNGSDSYPAPPSSANEYIYQRITFPGTRRIGPDMSRVGIKRPSRDWHKGHFWSPKTASEGSIMPAFRHFFDFDPRGTSKQEVGIPNYKFEAIFQYLMTKGTRITSPNQAWWLGLDPVQTKEIIEGRRQLSK